MYTMVYNVKTDIVIKNNRIVIALQEKLLTVKIIRMRVTLRRPRRHSIREENKLIQIHIYHKCTDFHFL